MHGALASTSSTSFRPSPGPRRGRRRRSGSRRSRRPPRRAQSQTTARATSSGSPVRRSGICATTRSRSPGSDHRYSRLSSVSIQPGCTMFVRTPSGPSSQAMPAGEHLQPRLGGRVVRLILVGLVARGRADDDDAARRPARPSAAPPAARSGRGPTGWCAASAPTSSCASSRKRRRRVDARVVHEHVEAPVALDRPPRTIASAGVALADVGQRALRRAAGGRGSASSVVGASSSSRSFTTTRALLAPNASAMPRPIPRPAPVTSTTLPASSGTRLRSARPRRRSRRRGTRSRRAARGSRRRRARKIAAAISLGSIQRRVGTRSSSLSSSIAPVSTRIIGCGVRVMPGLTASTRTFEPASAHSTASACVSETTPAFDAL